MNKKIGILSGIALITITGSLSSLPFLMDENNSKNSIEDSFSKLESSENRMLDFIEQEKNEIAIRTNQFNEYP